MSTESFSSEISWPIGFRDSFDSREDIESPMEIYECTEFEAAHMQPSSPLYRSIRITLYTRLIFVCTDGNMVECPLSLAFRECAIIRDGMASGDLETVKDNIRAPGIFERHDAAMFVFFMHECSYAYRKGSKEIHEELDDHVRMFRLARALEFKRLCDHSSSGFTELIDSWTLLKSKRSEKKAIKRAQRQNLLPPVTVASPKPITPATVAPGVARSMSARAQRPKLTIRIPRVESKNFPFVGTVKMNYLDFVLPQSETRSDVPQSEIYKSSAEAGSIAAPAPKRRRLVNRRGQAIRA